MPELPDDLKALQFTSNVIQLEPDKKYLLVIRGMAMNHYELERIHGALRARGITNLVLSLPEEADLDVIEVPASEDTPA